MSSHNTELDDKKAKSIIESLLFIAGTPLSLKVLKDIIELPEKEIHRLITELTEEYKDRGIMVIEVAEGFQMATNNEHSPWVKKLITTKIPSRLSQKSLETLALIAYKQPITKAEIEAIRGVNSEGVIRTLLDRKIIKILGRKEVPGRPLLYGTSKEFLHYLGLKSLSELPTFKDLQ